MAFSDFINLRMPGSWVMRPGHGFALGETPIGNLPACNSTRAGEQRRIASGTGVGARQVVCEYDGRGYAWRDRVTHRYDIRAYGAKVDGDQDGGGTNDAVAVQATIDAAEAAIVAGEIPAAEIYFPPGNTKIVFAVGDELLISQSNMHVRGDPGSIIDVTGNATSGPNVNIFAVRGDNSEPIEDLTFDGVFGERHVHADSSYCATLTAQDLVRIGSDAIFDPAMTDIPIGEFNFVKEINPGTTINLYDALRDDYTVADNAFIQKVIPLRHISFEGLHFIGRHGLIDTDGTRCNAIKPFYCMDVYVHSCTFEGIAHNAIMFTDVVFGKVSNCHFEHEHTISQLYAIAFTDNCMECIASENTFWDIRHCLSSNNQSGEHGIPRRILFHGNVCLNIVGTTSALGHLGGGDCIDTHGAAEDIFVMNNVVMNSLGSGINIECRSGVVCDNIVLDTGFGYDLLSDANGIYLHNETNRKGYFVCTGNYVRNASNVGIWISGGSDAAGGAESEGLHTVVCANNTIDGAGATPLRIGSTQNDIEQFTCVGNVIYAESGMVFVRARNGTVSGNSVDVSSGAAGVSPYEFNDCKDITINGNLGVQPASATGAGFNTVATTLGSTTKLLFGAGNKVVSPSSVSAKGVTLVNNATSCIIGKANDFSQVTTKVSAGTGTGHSIASRVSADFTIASGVITLTDENLVRARVDTEASAATDDLDTISGGVDGQMLSFASVASTRDTTFKDGTGNLRLAGDFTLTSTDDTITLRCDGTNWRELARSDNG